MDKFNAKKVKNQIVDWIQYWFKNNGPDCKAVIGISGGKDSSVVAALCVEALGVDRVLGVLMPQGEQHDISASYQLVDFLGIKYTEINIGETVKNLYEGITECRGTFTANLNKMAKTNTPARIRMTTLYAVAACVNGRVANTCNLSEDWVGYATKFGDGAGDFSPLMNLTVTEVKAIGKELGLPQNLIDKVPEDGLTGKTDEENFGFTYDVLDKYIRTEVCDDPVIKEKIDKMFTANLHKMRSMPSFDYNPEDQMEF